MSLGIDEDTAKTIQGGRQAVGDVLASAQQEGRKVFIVFLVGLLGTIMALRGTGPFGDGIWGFLRENTKSRMQEAVAANVDIIARNPFDVILIQVKIGLFVGAALAIPMILYYSRHALRRRGVTAAVPISRAKVAGFLGLSATLFSMGVFYAYAVFFPFMFSFLAANALSATIKPSYDIVMYVQFLLLLTVSFGIAAQLPLFMSSLAYTEIVSYEFFRDKWRHAVVIIFIFGAVFSPPDPFTQVMWGIPLVGLYGFSLGLAKVVTNVRRRGEADDAAPTIKATLLRLTAVFVVGAFGAYSFVYYEGFAWVNSRILPQLPALARPSPLSVEGLVGVSGTAGMVAFVFSAGAVAVFLALMALVAIVLRQPVEPRGPAVGDPTDVDLSELDAAGIRAAPPEAFAEMTEDDALTLAQQAIQDDDHARGQAILDRFDEAQELVDAKAEAETESGDDDVQAGSPSADPEDDSSVFTSTAAGMASSFTEEETTEDDIGGYYYDLRFIFESLTSKMFRLVGVFMLTIGASFYWLYQGGLGQMKALFLSRVDEDILLELTNPPIPPDYTVGFGHVGSLRTGGNYAIRPDALAKLAEYEVPGFVVALHPVEHIIFEVKVSVIIGVIITLPLVLYYAWPPLKERGIVSRGNENAFLVWGGSMIAGITLGSLFGFFYVAPAIISFLVEDALSAGMIINYRLNAFLWMVLYTTAGVGVVSMIPVSMLLFDRSKIVSYETMHNYWREVVFAVVVGITFLTPAGVLLMLLTAIPIVIAYLFGLFVLWFLTLPRRVRRDGFRGIWPS